MPQPQACFYFGSIVVIKYLCSGIILCLVIFILLFLFGINNNILMCDNEFDTKEN